MPSAALIGVTARSPSSQSRAYSRRLAYASPLLFHGDMTRVALLTIWNQRLPGRIAQLSRNPSRLNQTAKKHPAQPAPSTVRPKTATLAVQGGPMRQPHRSCSRDSRMNDSNFGRHRFSGRQHGTGRATRSSRTPKRSAGCVENGLLLQERDCYIRWVSLRLREDTAWQIV
jgi:hypothetical protein